MSVVEPPASSPSLPTPPDFTDALGLFSAQQRDDLETMSANFAEAAMSAHRMLTSSAARAVESPQAHNMDPMHVAGALGEVMTALAAQPERLMKAQTELYTSYIDLWRNAAMIASGQPPATPIVSPTKGDKRFNDPEWSGNPVFDIIKQSYLIASNWLNNLVAGVEGIDPLTRRRVEFATKMMTDALAPTNFLMSNPAALRAAVETKGESIAQGMANLSADMERGGGQLAISQTDLTKFEVGVNVATAPGKVIFQNELIQLLQFDASTEKAFDVPLLIFRHGSTSSTFLICAPKTR